MSKQLPVLQPICCPPGTPALDGAAAEALAVTFKAQGPLADPEISVNPLAALAPGFLRRFVELLERPTEPPTQDPSPQRTP